MGEEAGGDLAPHQLHLHKHCHLHAHLRVWVPGRSANGRVGWSTEGQTGKSLKLLLFEIIIMGFGIIVPFWVEVDGRLGGQVGCPPRVLCHYAVTFLIRRGQFHY